MSIFSIGGSTPSDDAVEGKSVRLDNYGADNAANYLARMEDVWTSDGNQETWTISWWMKWDNEVSSNERFIYHVRGDAATGNVMGNDVINLVGGQLQYYCYTSAWSTLRCKIKTHRVFRDPAAWYHCMVVMDSTLVVAADRTKFYINGVRETSFDTDTQIPQNQATNTNMNASTYIGASISVTSTESFGGYLAEFCRIDGQALGPEYFGETDSDTNQWKPKAAADVKAAVTFGTNGFYLPFSNDALATSFTDAATFNTKAFTSTGSTTWVCPTGVTEVKALVVGGGGQGGGNHQGGGGGAGGLVYKATYSVTPGTSYTVTVGAGGTGSASPGGAGGDSVFGTLTAKGGGGGGNSSNTSGADGGSGGGGGTNSNGVNGKVPGSETQTSQPGESGSLGFGNGGGIGSNGSAGANTLQAGGGGGAGAAGEAAIEGTRAGNGGAGKDYSSVFGTSYGASGWFAGGGGGGSYAPYPAGTGSNGGGTGATACGGGAGQANTGSGGGGVGDCGGSPPGQGGAGGSGIVLLKYNADVTGRHTVTANADAKNIRVSNHSVSANADAHIIGPKVGSSAISFDGDGDYLSIPDSADWNFGTGSFTIEGWVNHGGQETVLYFDYTDYVAGNEDLIVFHINAAGEPKYDDAIGGSGQAYGNFGQLPLNTWAHLAFVKIGTGLKCYIDGVAQLVKSGSSGTTDSYTLTMPASLPNHTQGLWIGRYGWNGTDTGTGRYTKGYMDEIRVSNSARYIANFTPPTAEFTSDANTKLLIHSNAAMGSTTFTDSSSGAHTITAGGGIKHVAPKIGTGMGAFDGTGDYLSVPASNQFDFSTTGQFTIEFWCNIAVVTGHQALVHSPNYYVAGNNGNWAIDMYQGDVRMNLYNGTGAVGSVDCSGAHITAGQWHHVAVARDSGGTTRIFVDGTLRSPASTNFNGQDIEDGKNGVEIGGNISYAGPGDLKGYVDEVRISKTARYTSNFTPSTTAYKDDVDTALLLHMDGGGGIDATTNLPTLVGQGTYFWDASTNAIFYDSEGVPTNKSIISFDGTGDYLSVPNSSDFEIAASNSNSFTVELWAKLDLHDDQETFLSQSSSGSTLWRFRNYHGNGVSFQVYDSGSLIVDVSGAEIDDTDWHHVALVKVGNGADSTYTLYKDGTSIGTSTDSSTLTINGQLDIGSTYSAGDPFQGKMDQIRISDNARYSSNFTAPTTPFTADANTLLLIQSDFSEGGLGADHSGEYNYFTPTNLTASDMVEDSPSNNFCTVNPLTFPRQGDTTALWGKATEGNLRWTSTGGSWGGHCYFGGTFSIAPNTGKYYWEMLDIGNKGIGSFANFMWGIGLIVVNDGPNGSGYIGRNTSLGANTGYRYTKSNSEVGTRCSYNGTPSSENVRVPCDSTGPMVYKFCFDTDNGKFYFGGDLGWTTYNTTATPEGSSGPTATNYLFNNITYDVTPLFYAYQATTHTDNMHNFGQDSSFAGNVTGTSANATDENGKGNFYYTPPAGYVALCTDNLSAPSIALPPEHNNSVLYTGDGQTTQAVTGVGFEPDFLWLKSRTTAAGNIVQDVVRGPTTRLETNLTGPEVTDATYVASFDSDGFTVGNNVDTNANEVPYVTFNWKAGGAASANTDGTINSSVSANTTAGFSIVTFTGNQTSGATVGHGLSQAPEMIIVKGRSFTDSWGVYHFPAMSNTHGVLLNSDVAEINSVTYWNDTTAGASVFTLGNDTMINKTGQTMLAYCFHSVEGYSKVGSYKGNGVSQDGPFVYLGFKPAFLMIKNISSTAWWGIWSNKLDPDNTVTYEVYPNSNVAIGNNTGSANGPGTFDFTSNGFKGRRKAAESMTNTNGNTYAYVAFAESPFKTTNAV